VYFTSLLIKCKLNNLLGNTQILLVNIIFSLTYFSSVAAIIKVLQFKEWHKTDEGLGSVVGIATGYMLDGQGIKSW
jgi:hypothetical protein